MHAPQGPTLVPCTLFFAPSRLPSFSRTQVSLSIKYGHVLLYDDTAVKNKYRLPVGIGAVIDGEYFTRVAFQMISSDTQTETFEWMMEAWKETRGGEGPDVFIQDADAACTLAASRVFKGAKKLRCQWHLWKNVKEKLGGILGGNFKVSTIAFVLIILGVTGMSMSFQQQNVSFRSAPGVAAPWRLYCCWYGCPIPRIGVLPVVVAQVQPPSLGDRTTPNRPTTSLRRISNRLRDPLVKSLASLYSFSTL